MYYSSRVKRIASRAHPVLNELKRHKTRLGSAHIYNINIFLCSNSYSVKKRTEPRAEVVLCSFTALFGSLRLPANTIMARKDEPSPKNLNVEMPELSELPQSTARSNIYLVFLISGFQRLFWNFCREVARERVAAKHRQIKHRLRILSFGFERLIWYF